MADLVKLEDNLSGTLTALLSDSETASMSVSNPPSIVTEGWITVNPDTSGSEKIKFTGVSGSTLTGLTRGVDNGGVGKEHQSGSPYELRYVSEYQNELVDAVKAEHNDDGTHSDITVASINVDDDSTDSNVFTSSMHRQAIMNGNFDIWQRGTSFTPTNLDYMVDRWQSNYNADGGSLPTDTFTRQVQTAGDVAGSFFFLRLTVDGAGSGFGTGAHYDIRHKIEHGTRYLCGNGKKVTLSFYAKSDIADKKLGFYLTQGYGTGGAPTSAETINGDAVTLTSSWTKYTHTFSTNTLSGKAFGTNYDDALTLQLCYLWSTDRDERVGESTAETFVDSGNIDIAQVQLCAGEIALPFQPKSYGDELKACQRFYEVSSALQQWRSPAATTQTLSYTEQFKVTKRVAATVTVYAVGSGTANNVRKNGASDIAVGVGGAKIEGFIWYFSAATALALDDYLQWYWTASAEL